MESLTSVGTFDACVNQSVQKRELRQKPNSTVGEILATAGLTIQEETRTDKAAAAKTLKKQTVPEIYEFLARCGVTAHD